MLLLIFSLAAAITLFLRALISSPYSPDTSTTLLSRETQRKEIQNRNWIVDAYRNGRLSCLSFSFWAISYTNTDSDIFYRILSKVGLNVSINTATSQAWSSALVHDGAIWRVAQDFSSFVYFLRCASGCRSIFAFAGVVNCYHRFFLNLICKVPL